MLTEAQRAAYRDDGFLVIPGVFSAAEIAELRAVTDGFVERSAGVAANDDVFDLEDTHSAGDPRVRRIKTPHLHDPVYGRASRHPAVVAILEELWGSVRLDTGKLNMKSAGYGASIEWHQDWAFYPHTNDDLAAVGIMLDDFTPENGPMLVLPGSHHGPILDHHDAEGRFCGAIAPEAAGLDVAGAVPCLGPAGSITIHHVRLVHGSATNFSGRERRFLLYQYRAADAWPLLGFKDGIEKFDELLLAGRPTLEPRLAPVPVRLPLPPASNQGSIYENQRTAGRRFFEAAAPRAVAAE
ncbi:MAG TPA: phytanoyl-CoA dioxygenase family protein [Stellaceae bacterium]|nr:phytanoyl-CoA dioxygenase family protein [Stellaceae bacterium]